MPTQKRFSLIGISLLCMLAVFSNSSVALNEEEVQEAYEKSYQYEKLGNYTDAINTVSLILKQYPKTYNINMRLAYLYLLNQNYANATSHYTAAQKAKQSAYHL